MLIYNPAFDVKHCIYRFLSSLEIARWASVPWAVFRMLDLYRLYPKLLLEIKPFPKDLSTVKKKTVLIHRQYSIPQDPRKTLYQINPIHGVVANYLIAKGFISKKQFEIGRIEKTDLEMPQELKDIFTSDILVDQEWLTLLINHFPQSKFIGHDGIKKRTGYMEYRYDPK
ncbi:MAG: ABC-three component system middle component 5 [Solidesulfovibrio sp.]